MQLIRKGFTLIELVIVIGVIGIIATILLLNINPGETQRKARDTQRIKDATTLQFILEQLLNEGATIPSTTNTIGASGGAWSNTAARTKSCSNSPQNWLGVDVCNFVNNIPVDPLDGRTIRVVSGGTIDTPTFSNLVARYGVRVNGTDYEIVVRQESSGNADKVLEDGGDSTQWRELYSGVNDLITN